MNLTVSSRQLVPEWMDQPDLDTRLHRQALTALDRINSVSLTASQLWREIAKRLRLANQRAALEEIDAPAKYSVLDVACGSGGVLLGIWERAARSGVRLECAGCDISVTALAVAKRQAEKREARIDFQQIDAANEPFARQYDFVISSLFLHHLDDGPAAELLRRMADAARLAVIVTDLRRTRLGYAYAWIATRLLSRSAVARVDGPRSVARAFTIDEVQRLAEQAGVTDAVVQKSWPQRFMLRWGRP